MLDFCEEGDESRKYSTFRATLICAVFWPFNS